MAILVDDWRILAPPALDSGGGSVGAGLLAALVYLALVKELTGRALEVTPLRTRAMRRAPIPNGFV